MIFGLEVGMLIAAVMGLVQGKLGFGKNRVVYGTPARLLAILGLLPMPTSIVAGVILALYTQMHGGDVHGAQFRTTAGLLEAGITLVYAVLLYGIGWRLGTPPPPPAH